LTAGLISFKHGFTMAKPSKKPAKKPVEKSTAKPAAKKAAGNKVKTPVKTAASKLNSKPVKAPKAAAQKPPAKEGLAKSVVSAVGKLFAKDKPDAKASGAAKGKTSPAPAEAKAGKKPAAGAGKKKKDKKSKDGLEMEEDDLLASDEEIGSEEIPDLSEFDENEAEEEVAADSADDDSDDATAIAEAKPAGDDEIVLTDAEGRRYCRVRDCDQISVVEGYCRYHYLLLWKKIQVRRKILVDGKLERYVEELTARYPDKFLEMIRKDLRTEKDFLNAIAELEIDESAGENEFEDEAQSYVDEIRGISTDTGMTEEEEF
jgi:hypothetical protein